MARALSEGTDEHTAEEFAAELERCGATLDAHADHPGVRVSLEVPASRLDKALGLLAEALRAPAFPEDEIKRLVANRLDEIPHELANPGRRAAMALSKELFPAGVRHSRPRQGTEETVRRIDAAAVRAFYADACAAGHRRPPSWSATSPASTCPRCWTPPSAAGPARRPSPVPARRSPRTTPPAW